MAGMREADLYAPIKAFLTRQGYDVKGEIGAADVMALRDGEPPVIVELKVGFSLTLFHQAITRLALTDLVYIAVFKPKGKRALKDNVAMARRLGIGVLTVRERDGTVEAQCDPGPYAPRKNKKKQGQMLREFERRVGDPNEGGATRHGIITAYRQDAIRCARFLAVHGASKGAKVAEWTEVPHATRIMRDDHYGWFTKVSKGIYDLSEQGRIGLGDYGDVTV